MEFAWCSIGYVVRAAVLIGMSLVDRLDFESGDANCAKNRVTRGATWLQQGIPRSTNILTPEEDLQVMIPQPPSRQNAFRILPVTKRVVKEYRFRDPGGGLRNGPFSLGHLQFSPDGQRLLAISSIPELVAGVWDVKSADLLREIRLDKARTAAPFVTPDWSAIYAGTGEVWDISPIKKLGLTMVRVKCDGQLRGWSLETGEPIATMEHTPQRRIEHMIVSPNGECVAAVENLPGDHWPAVSSARPVQLTIWDLKSQKPRSIGDRGDTLHGFFGEGRFLAARSNDNRELKWFELESGKLVWKHRFLEHEDHQPVALLDDGRLVVNVTIYDSKNRAERRCNLVYLDSATGRETGAAAIDAKLSATFVMLKRKPDTLLVATMTSYAEAFLRDSEMRFFSQKGEEWEETHRVEFKPQNTRYLAACGSKAFSPDGQWCAVVVGSQLKGKTIGDIVAGPQNSPQPQIWLINTETGKVAEEMILPQIHVFSISFAPDGNSLAVGCIEQVICLDISDLVGAKRRKAK